MASLTQQEQAVEDNFVKALKDLMQLHRPKGVWQTWLSGDGRVIIMKKKPDGSSDQG